MLVKQHGVHMIRKDRKDHGVDRERDQEQPEYGVAQCRMDNRFIAGNILSFCVGLRGMDGISFWPNPVPIAGGTSEVDGGQHPQRGAPTPAIH